jgi:uncharacterized tellurite resistance protein B-like protein
MTKADGKVSEDERKAVMQTIQSQFNLTEDETKSLKELAKEKIADLIYVEHKDFIEAKLRIKKKLSL